MFIVDSEGIGLLMCGAAVVVLFVVRDSGVILSFIVSTAVVAFFVVVSSVVGFVGCWMSQCIPYHPDVQLHPTVV